MYPEARMIDSMKIWQLPSGKEDMLSEVCQSGEYFAQEKIDGYWYQYEKTENYSYLFSRNVSVQTGCLTEKSENVPHLMKFLDSKLPNNTTLIGEIYYPGGTSKNVTTIMGCLPERAIIRQKDNPIHFYIHDIIMYDGVNLVNTAAEDRYKILAAIWNKHQLNDCEYLRLAELIEGNIEDKIAEILSQGGEGVVLKKKNLPYYPGKRPAWSTIKVKQVDFADVVCMGFEDATIEYTGKEIETWKFWEERAEMNKNGEYNWVKFYGDYYNEYSHNPHIYRPVSKGHYYGWKTSMRVGAYEENGELKEIGTVSSGWTDADRQDMADCPEDYLGHVFEVSMMQKDKQAKTFRHARVIRKREDKSAKDCILSEIFS